MLKMGGLSKELVFVTVLILALAMPIAQSRATADLKLASSSGEVSSSSSRTPCKEIVCDFESGSTCSYKPAGISHNSAENWGVHEAKYQNSLTGIKLGSKQGGKFAAAYTKKAGEKTTLETDTPDFDQPYVVRYEFYEATEGVLIRGCCNDESGCQKFTDEQVKISEYNTWQTDAFECAAGTKKVLFVCENTKGESEGACGIDNIQLFKSTRGDPGEATENLCQAL